MNRKFILLALLLTFSICTFAGQKAHFQLEKTYPSGDSAVLKVTEKILTLIKNVDYLELGNYFHPVEGVRFSPYGYIDTTTDIIFSQIYFKDLFSNTKPGYYIWGYYDGSGDTINLPIYKYFEKFVYDADFLHAEKTSLNQCLGGGNSQNNILVIYDGLPFTESYFSGFDKKYGGMDWRALRLVFKEYEGKYYLVGIIHDEWTI